MSGSTEALRKKIEGAADLKGIVRSMKAMAASTIGQYEEAARSLDQYYSNLEIGLGACFREMERGGLLPEPSAPREATIGAVIFGSDQGLVGRFNEVLLDFVTRTLGLLPRKTSIILAVGERMHASLPEAGLTNSILFAAPGSVDAITELVGRILSEIQKAREVGEVFEVYVFHNRPKSSAIFEPSSERLLPLDHLWRNTLRAVPWPTKLMPELIGGCDNVFPGLLEGYLFVLLFRACAESLASENASRLAAMQRAENNIASIIEDLNLVYHRARQESIDEELFDVISGYQALISEAQ